MRLISDADILRYANKVSDEKGVHLSPTMRAFFVSLVHLTFDEAHYDEEKNLYFLQYSCRDFSKITKFSFKMVCISLQALDDCGLINRVTVKRDFRHLSDGTFSVNKPNVTYLNLSLFVN